MILIDLNSADERPIYSQITDGVKFAVAAGVLRSGDLVPSVRELSKQLVVNPNTVAQSLSRPPSRRSAGVNPGYGFADR